MPEDRYIPDLSEVPPDPAEPLPIDHPGAGWRPFRCVPEYVEAEPEPAPPPRRYNYISVQAPRGPDDPCVISAAGREAKALPPLTDAEIEAALEPLRRDIEQAGGRLEVRYEEPVPQPKKEGLARLRATRADLLLFAKQFEQARDSEAVRLQWERASAAAAKLPVGHGKSLLWGGLLEELERAKEPPQLPPSPVVQAALVVDPEE